MVSRASLVVVALALAAVLAGCSGSDDSPRPTAGPTPISKLDVTGLRLVRAPFCDRVADSAVRAALGGKAQADDSWGNGDPVPESGASSSGDGGSGDVAHEVGCAWTGPSGAAARAWVFARPVDADFAGAVVRQAGQQQGCTAEKTPTFGSPAVLQTCTLPGGVERVRRAGLFGDTWLTCEVSGSPGGSRGRLDAWCAAVVAALDSA